MEPPVRVSGEDFARFVRNNKVERALTGELAFHVVDQPALHAAVR